MNKLRFDPIKKMCDEHNDNHPNCGILTVRKDYHNHYFIGLGMIPILQGISEDEAFWAVAAIKNYADAQ